jgi:hypothetical protein
VREHGKRGDHRHQMQEQNDVSQERIGHILALDDFEVIPHSLVGEPKNHARAHEDPEEPGVKCGGTRASDIGQERRGRYQQQQTIDKVTDNCEGRASLHEQRSGHLGQRQRYQQ